MNGVKGKLLLRVDINNPIGPKSLVKLEAIISAEDRYQVLYAGTSLLGHVRNLLLVYLQLGFFQICWMLAPYLQLQLVALPCLAQL